MVRCLVLEVIFIKLKSTIKTKTIVVDVDVEMFYLNTIKQLFLYVEQLDQLEVCLPGIPSDWNTNTGGIPKLKVEIK